MFLSGRRIVELVEAGNLVLDPFEPSLVKPASYVLRVGTTARRWAAHNDERALWGVGAEDVEPGPVEPTDGLVLDRDGFLLVTSLERIALPPDVLGLLAGLSHIARYGIAVLGDSALVAPGFGSTEPTALALELSSSHPGPLRLAAGMPICQLLLARIDDPDVPASRPLGRSIYEGMPQPEGPRLIAEFEPLLRRI